MQTFVFLWPPALRAFAVTSRKGAWGLDKDGEPAYGLIFAAMMASGVIGGFVEPTIRKTINSYLSLLSGRYQKYSEDNKHREFNSVSLHLLCASCYFVSAMLLLTPSAIHEDSTYAFSLSLVAFLLYEVVIGLYMPCEGVVRSIYMPNESVCSIMTMLRVIVNVAVACGVISTNIIPFTFAFGILSTMMITAAILQISLIDFHELQKNCGTLSMGNKKKK